MIKKNVLLLFLGKYEIVKFLINNKADLKLKDADGKTVLHRATEIQNIDIIQEILNACPELKEEIDKKGNVALNYIQTDELKNLFINFK